MRFLIGIFTGAVVTLLVATAMDAPTHPILNKATNVAASGWDRLIHATSSSLFEPAQDPAAEEQASAHRSAEPPPRAETANPSTVVQPAGESTTERASGAVDAASERATTPTAETRSVPARSAADSSIHAFNDEAQTAYAALEPTPALSPPEAVAESPSFESWAKEALAMELGNNANQPVWVPFHSQMSAEGFATRLSRALDHEFRVVRQGAGAYQVVFDATSADERALILAQVTEITGQ